MIKDKLINYFSKNIKDLMIKIDEEVFEKSQEIRIRLNKGICFKTLDEEYFICEDGTIFKDLNKKFLYKPTHEDIIKTFQTISDYSIYAFENEIKNGYITLKGGFRVGVSGTVVNEENSIKTIKNISSINIRLAREIKECSKNILNYIFDKTFKSTIIVSPPGCGKTTLIRDIIRNISNSGLNVAVVDERSELAATFRGQAEMDLGIRTDVLDKSPKDLGMINLLRSMNPDVIAVDEIGTSKDTLALEKISASGVKVICSLHASNLKDLKNHSEFDNILNKKLFERFIFLNTKNSFKRCTEIYDENFKLLFEGEL